MKLFGTQPRRYNVAVIPTGSGDYWVYWYPATTRPGYWTSWG